MPAGKRILLAAALALPAALLALSAGLAASGRPGAGAGLALATVAAGLAALQALWPRFDLTGRSLRRGPAGARQVALTFDDGPSRDTPAVLDALDRAGVRATFFVLGRAALAAPGLVREIARRGHAVALHGHTHAKLTLAGPRRIAEELDRCAAAIRAAGVVPAPLFRAPHGLSGPFLPRALARRGLTLVGWTRGVFDTERPGAAIIATRACRRMRAGEILLLHDGCGTPGLDPARDQTATAVPEIVERWRARGYTFVTVDGFLRRRRSGGGALARLRALAPAAEGGGRRRRAVRLLGLAVLLAFAAVAARQVDLRAVLQVLAEARWPLVLLACASNVLSLALHTRRWLAVVHGSGARVRFRDGFAAVTAGYAAGLVLPARAGDVLRAAVIGRRAHLSTASALTAAGLDYVIGAATLVPLFPLLAVAGPLPPWARAALLASSALGLGGLVVAFLLRPRGEGGRGFRRGGPLATRLRAGLAAARDPAALARACGWGLLGWAAELLIAACALAALGLPAGVAAATIAVVASTAANVVAISPGNAGPFELAVTVALARIGVEPAAALAFSLLYHLVHLVPVTLLGAPALLAEARSRERGDAVTGA